MPRLRVQKRTGLFLETGCCWLRLVTQPLAGKKKQRKRSPPPQRKADLDSSESHIDYRRSPPRQSSPSGSSSGSPRRSLSPIARARLNQCQGPGVKSKPAVGGKCGARSEGEGEGMLAIGGGGGDPSKSQWRGSPRRQPLAAVVRALLISAPAPLASTCVHMRTQAVCPNARACVGPSLNIKLIRPVAQRAFVSKKIEVSARGFVFLG